MRRREFMSLIGGAAILPVAARAQQQAVPVVGSLRSTRAAPFQHLVGALRQGLQDEDFIEGRNVAIEFRYADDQPSRLPALVADLLRLPVAVIVGNVPAAVAAKAATATVPIVFVTGGDPIQQGLVTSLSRPGSNVTGVTFFGFPLNAKRMELLHELVPDASPIAVLSDPGSPDFQYELSTAEAAGRAIGRKIIPVTAASEHEFDGAFARIAQSGAGALLVGAGPFLNSRRGALIALAARHRLPAIYVLREFVEAGGLISYSASIGTAYRQAGAYAGRILRGVKPSELPVLQPTTFELAINLKTARTLGITVPPGVLSIADEVIE